MRTLVLFFLAGFCTLTQLQGQVKIGDNPQTIDPAAVLELESTTMALIITRVTTEQMEAIIPGQGALVYNTDTACVHYYDGTAWVNLCTGANVNISADPIVNQAENGSEVSTIVLTQTDEGTNIEVATESITGNQILDGSIFGNDFNDNSITGNKLANNAVTAEKISENAVGPFAINRDSLPLSFFNNDVPFLVAGDVTTVSADADNSITPGGDGGAFFNASPLFDAIANDLDDDPANEVQALSRSGNDLILTRPNGASFTIALDDLAGTGTDDQNLGPATLDAANMLTIEIENGNEAMVDLSSLAGGPGGGSDNISFEITTDSLQITDGAGTLGVPLVGLGSGGGTPQNASEVPFTPYLSLDSTNTQAVVEQLKDEVDAIVATGGGSNNTTFEVTVDSLQITDGAGTLGVALSQLGVASGPPQTAAQEEFVPYLTIDSTNTQAAIEQLKDELDLVSTSGGATNIDFTIANDSIQITDAGGTLGFPLADLGSGGNNIDFIIANDSLTISDVGGNLSVPLAEIGANTDFAVVGDSLRITDVSGEYAVALDQIAASGNNTAVLVTVDSLLVEDAGARLGFPLIELGNALGSYNTSLEVANDSLVVADGNSRQGLTLTDLGTATGAYNSGVEVANDSLLVIDGNGRQGLLLTEILTVGIDSARNVGTAGEGLFLEKNGLNLDFKTINAGSNRITITNDAANNEVDIDVDQTELIVPAAQITYDPASGELPATATNTQIALDSLAARTNRVSLDNQQLTLETGNLLTLERGGTAIDLTSILDDQTAAQVSVAATATNYVAATADVEAHLAGIDAALEDVGGHLNTDNLMQTLNVDRTYDINGGNLIFTGTGSVGIGNAANPPDNKLHVAGAIRAEGVLNSEGVFDEPSYRFSSDIDTGIYNPAADQIGFSAGATEAMRISEAAGATTVTINEFLGDGLGATGDPGDLLTATATGIAWADPSTATSPVKGFGKINIGGIPAQITSGFSVTRNNATGTYTVDIDLNVVTISSDYTIQLTVQGRNRIYVSGQTASSFDVRIEDDNSQNATYNNAVNVPWHFTILD